MQIYDFHDFFYYCSIFTASFNKIRVFYRDRIIENDLKYILNINKYIASIYSNVLTEFNPEKYLWDLDRGRYIIIAETISNLFYKNIWMSLERI